MGDWGWKPSRNRLSTVIQQTGKHGKVTADKVTADKVTLWGLVQLALELKAGDTLDCQCIYTQMWP